MDAERRFGAGTFDASADPVWERNEMDEETTRISLAMVEVGMDSEGQMVRPAWRTGLTVSWTVHLSPSQISRRSRGFDLRSLRSRDLVLRTFQDVPDLPTGRPSCQCHAVRDFLLSWTNKGVNKARFSCQVRFEAAVSSLG